MFTSIYKYVFFRFGDPYYWSPWILIGKDVHVNVIQIRHSVLDQTLDTTEKAVEEETGKEFLNPKNAVAKGREGE